MLHPKFPQPNYELTDELFEKLRAHYYERRGDTFSFRTLLEKHFALPEHTCLMAPQLVLTGRRRWDELNEVVLGRLHLLLPGIVFFRPDGEWGYGTDAAGFVVRKEGGANGLRFKGRMFPLTGCLPSLYFWDSHHVPKEQKHQFPHEINFTRDREYSDSVLLARTRSLELQRILNEWLPVPVSVFDEPEPNAIAMSS